MKDVATSQLRQSLTVAANAYADSLVQDAWLYGGSTQSKSCSAHGNYREENAAQHSTAHHITSHHITALHDTA